MNRTVFYLAMGCLILGGLVLGFQAVLKKNVLSIIFKQYAWVLFLLIGASALLIGFTRDTYLPFLGETVMPCSVLKDTTPENATHYAKIKAPPGAKILYWAAEPANEDLDSLKDWRQAYLGFKNAGVVTAGADGIATLRFREPQPYKVPMAGKLEPHVHYRTCANQGILGRVETIGTLQSQMKEAHTELGDSNIQSAIESFLDKVEKETQEHLPTPVVAEAPIAPHGASLTDKSVPEPLPQQKQTRESFMDFAPATFVGEEAPKQMTDDNTLYYLAAETEKNRLPLSEMGMDESPQPAGSDYATAFITTIPQ